MNYLNQLNQMNQLNSLLFNPSSEDYVLTCCLRFWSLEILDQRVNRVVTVSQLHHLQGSDSKQGQFTDTKGNDKLSCVLLIVVTVFPGYFISVLVEVAVLFGWARSLELQTHLSLVHKWDIYTEYTMSAFPTVAYRGCWL